MLSGSSHCYGLPSRSCCGVYSIPYPWTCPHGLICMHNIEHNSACGVPKVSTSWSPQRQRSHRSNHRSILLQATPDVRVATSFVLTASTLVTAALWWYYVAQLPEQQVPQASKPPGKRPQPQDTARAAGNSSSQQAVGPDNGVPLNTGAPGNSVPTTDAESQASPTQPRAVSTSSSEPVADEPKIVYKKPPSDAPYLLLTLVLAAASAYTVYTRGWR